MPQPTVFDDVPEVQAQAQPSNKPTVFDDPPQSTSGHGLEDWLGNFPGRVAGGVARGLGIPTSRAELEQMGKQPSVSDLLMKAAGPIPEAAVGMGKNLYDAGKRVVSGDVVGGASQVAGAVAPLFMGGEEFGATPKGLPEAGDVHPSIKKLTETLPVTDKMVPRFQTAAQTAVPALKEFETPQSPITLKNWHAAQDLAESKRNDAAESFLAPARARGVQVDGNIIADEMQKAIPKVWASDPKYAQQYKVALDEANSYRRPMSIDENIDAIKHNNARLTPFYKASPDQQYGLQVGGFPVNELEAEARGRRAALAKAVDPEHDGQNFEQIRREQSDLITFRQHGEALENKLQKQYTPTGLQTAGQKLSDLGSIWHGDYRQALASKMKQAPQLDKMFSDAFRDYNGPDNPPTPMASPSKSQLIPPSRQLGPGPIRMGTTDPTTVHIQVGKPLAPPLDPNFTLTSPAGKAEFIRQRNWNEVLADPKTLANENTEVGQHRMDLQQQGPQQHFLRQLGLDEQ